MKTFAVKSLWLLALLITSLSSCNKNDALDPLSKQGRARDGGENDLEYDIDYVPGSRPLASFTDACAFRNDIWNRSVQYNREYFGVVTIDGYYLITQQTGEAGGHSAGLIRNNSTQQAYYYYPVLGNPAPAFNHRIVRLGGQPYYASEIQATVHSHTPCINDGTDGVSQQVSPADASLADLYQNIQHIVVGCNNVVANFNYYQSYYYDKRECSSFL